jgi:hypothetical protein
MYKIDMVVPFMQSLDRYCLMSISHCSGPGSMSVLGWDMGIFFEQIGSYKEKYVDK